MPLEKQNKRKTDREEREKIHREGERGTKERNGRLDSEEEEIRRCSRLLKRNLCKTCGEKMIDNQNYSW